MVMAVPLFAVCGDGAAPLAPFASKVTVNTGTSSSGLDPWKSVPIASQAQKAIRAIFKQIKNNMFLFVMVNLR
jgi:hypothetical protein